MSEQKRFGDGILTRREILVRGAVAGAGFSVAGGILAACGGGSSGTGGTGGSTERGLSELPSGSPKSGGRLTVAALSGGSAETLNPGTALINADFARIYSLFNYLFYVGRDLNPVEPGLAMSATPNADATKYVLRLREGVEWHDGKPFTADDVVWNIAHLWASPDNYAYYAVAPIVDFKGVRKLNQYQVEVPLLRPFVGFESLLSFYNFGIVQNGTTSKDLAARPVGTGPFVFDSFTPGQQSVFKANKNYWEEGKPYVEELVVDSSFTDDTARFNALQSGAVDLVPSLQLTTARAQLSSQQVQVLESSRLAQTFVFIMRVDKAPFSDNRVREGFKYAVDRQALIDGALAGFGQVGNDLPGRGVPYFASDLVREHDPEKAKSLFKAAGVDNVTLQTAPVFDGQVQSATLLAQQAKAAGMTVKLDQLSAENYFTESGGFLSRSFGQDIFQPIATLSGVYQETVSEGAPYNETHWGSQSGGAPKVKMITEAQSAIKHAQAQEMWRKVQETQFNEGGYIMWATYPYVDGAGQNIRGLKAGAGFNYNNWRFQDGWLD